MSAPAAPERTPHRPPIWPQVGAALRHPASLLFIALWLLAAAVEAWRGPDGLLLQVTISLALLFTIATGLLLFLTPDPPPADSPRQSRGMLWLQVAILFVLILLTGWSGMRFHQVTPGWLESIPIWSPLEAALERAGGRLLGHDNYLRNPVLYVVIPGLILLLMGVRTAELGLRKGYRTWAVVRPYIVVLAVVALINTLMGQPEYLFLMPRRIISHFLQNGFMEEFLFRGALMSRLTPLIGEGWSVVLSSLLFGVWHLGTDTAMLGGDYMAGLAFSIVSQAALGMVFGLIAVRTRSLVAPTVAHITVNMLG